MSVTRSPPSTRSHGLSNPVMLGRTQKTIIPQSNPLQQQHQILPSQNDNVNNTIQDLIILDPQHTPAASSGLAIVNQNAPSSSQSTTNTPIFDQNSTSVQFVTQLSAHQDTLLSNAMHRTLDAFSVRLIL